METLPGSLAIGHVRYSTAGAKGAAIRDVQPFFGEFAMGGAAIAPVVVLMIGFVLLDHQILRK